MIVPAIVWLSGFQGEANAKVLADVKLIANFTVMGKVSDRQLFKSMDAKPAIDALARLSKQNLVEWPVKSLADETSEQPERSSAYTLKSSAVNRFLSELWFNGCRPARATSTNIYFISEPGIHNHAKAVAMALEGYASIIDSTTSASTRQGAFANATYYMSFLNFSVRKAGRSKLSGYVDYVALLTKFPPKVSKNLASDADRQSAIRACRATSRSLMTLANSRLR